MIKSRLELQEKMNRYAAALRNETKKILVCAGTGCVAGGSLEIFDRFKKLAEEKGLSLSVELAEEPHADSIGLKKSGCHGFCEMGPLVRIEPSGWLYIKVKPDDCEEIIQRSIVEGKTVDRLIYTEKGISYAKQGDIPFYKKQKRLVLEHCGHLNCESIEEYIAMGGYGCAAKALFELKPHEIISQIKESNLRGRGGGGYPTGRKWEQVAAQVSDAKYIVCNGDEGDPGAFMDRSIMEGDPHRMIEGMLIAAYAAGAHEGYIYVRAEYPLAVKRLECAIASAKSAGLLGKNILGSGFDFEMHISQGAGAFVCGEGSALTASIEGNRGMPRVKPPRTVEQGLFGKPTVLNNVETYANVPLIIEKGPDWYKSIGPEKSPGTKAFAITGNVNNTGLIEVPMGTTLREVIFDIGGGVKNNKKFKAVQIGGPSGGCLTSEHLDLPLDFDSLKKAGAMIGSGGLVVMDEDTCMVEVARFFMNFTQNESCGKCVPCREGTMRMLDILQKIVDGQGAQEDIGMLEDLADTISKTALCGLGKTAAFPVISTIHHFRDEYIAHVREKICPAGACRALLRIEIDPEKCVGCGLCRKKCPVDAIDGKVKQAFVIQKELCIKCGECIKACKFGAVRES